MKTILLTLAVTMLLSTQSLAHEGHEKTPGALSAPHGGQVKSTSQIYIELVSDEEGFKIYPLSHDMKTVLPQNIKIEATVKFPKKPKAETLKFLTADSFLEAKVDAKGAHRYTVDMKVTQNGKTEKLSFNVEPQ